MQGVLAGLKIKHDQNVERVLMSHTVIMIKCTIKNSKKNIEWVNLILLIRYSAILSCLR